MTTSSKFSVWISIGLVHGLCGLPLKGATGQSLYGTTKRVVDSQVTEVLLDAASLVAELQWIDGGAAFLAVANTGVLHRVTFPALREEARLDLGAPATSLQLSRSGALVALSNSRVAIVDPATLQVEGSLPAPGIYYLASAPGLDVAFGAARRRAKHLEVLDLPGMSVLKRVDAQAFWNGVELSAGQPRRRLPRNFSRPAVSADGRYLFCLDFGSLHRFRVEGRDLIYDGGGPWVTKDTVRVETSPDSLYVAVPATGVSNTAPNHPRLGYGFFVYRVGDLETPVLGLRSGYYPHALGFDQKNGRLFAHDRDLQLITFHGRGGRLEEYSLTQRGDEVRQLLSHPGGQGVLVLTREHLLWVRWE